MVAAVAAALAAERRRRHVATSCTARRSGSTRCSSGRAPSSACSRPAASATSSRSRAAIATIRTTCSGGRRRRSSRAACALTVDRADAAPTATVHRPIDLADVAEALAIFAADGVDAVAVAFLNAYANPAHELAAPTRCGGSASTARSRSRTGLGRVPRVRAHVHDRDRRVRAAAHGPLPRARSRARSASRGFAGESLITRSGGGAMTFDRGRGAPVRDDHVGPGRRRRSARPSSRASSGSTSVITADVGGTSFDTCLITDGQAPVLYEGTVVGLPVQTPWVDVRSIGAGGGSIAYVDVGGLLHVGPASAGAVPGPACYGRGGTEPTVTDAAVVLGMLGPVELASGIELSTRRAEAALAPLAGRLGFESAADVARGILHIAAATMANAIREITVEQGRDPREAALVAFGGAGPLFGTLLADELDIDTIVVPRYAGNFSAWGLLGADLAQTAVAHPYHAARRTARCAEVDALAAELFAELESRTPARGAAARGAPRHALRRPGAHAHRSPLPSTDGRIAADAAGARARSSSASTPARSATRWTRSSRSSRCGPLRTRCRARAAESPRDRRAATRTHGARRRLVVRARTSRCRSRSSRAIPCARATRSPVPRSSRDDRDDLPRRRLRRRDAIRAARSSPGGSAHECRHRLAAADPVTTEVIRHGLNSAAEQMKRALVRTAFSPDHLRGARLRGRDLRPRDRDCSRRRRACRSSWAR